MNSNAAPGVADHRPFWLGIELVVVLGLVIFHPERGLFDRGRAGRQLDRKRSTGSRSERAVSGVRLSHPRRAWTAHPAIGDRKMDREGIYSDRPLTLEECRQHCGKPHYPCRLLWKPCAMPCLSAHERLTVSELLNPLSDSKPLEVAILERFEGVWRSVRARLRESPGDVRLAIAHQQLAMLRGMARELSASRADDDAATSDPDPSANRC